jgi:hypothetical protein
MELTDLEICKRIAEIEGLKIHSKNQCSVNVLTCNNGLNIPIAQQYNPLTDDALCFQLMVKYKVDVEFFTDCVSGYIGGSCKGESIGNTTNQAICLAIIEAHNE